MFCSFLDDLDRIATRTYEPSDDDIVRARLRTVGVQEYRIQFGPESGSDPLGSMYRCSMRFPFSSYFYGVLDAQSTVFGTEWTLYDVGGSRTLVCSSVVYYRGLPISSFFFTKAPRMAPILRWCECNYLPYVCFFSLSLHAYLTTLVLQSPVTISLIPIYNQSHLINTAPPAISCFDERLLVDPSVNRLEDSFLLWRAVCSSKLLVKSTMILFLNKCDILHRKLRSGVQVKNFLTSYGDRPNDTPTAIKCSCQFLSVYLVLTVVGDGRFEAEI